MDCVPVPPSVLTYQSFRCELTGHAKKHKLVSLFFQLLHLFILNWRIISEMSWNVFYTSLALLLLDTVSSSSLIASMYILVSQNMTKCPIHTIWKDAYISIHLLYSQESLSDCWHSALFICMSEWLSSDCSPCHFRYSLLAWPPSMFLHVIFFLSFMFFYQECHFFVHLFVGFCLQPSTRPDAVQQEQLTEVSNRILWRLLKNIYIADRPRSLLILGNKCSGGPSDSDSPLTHTV